MFNKPNITRSQIITGILVIVIMYFSFFFLFGRYGFIKYTQSKRSNTVREQELSVTQEHNQELEKKINSFKNNNIDKDLLDEQVRKNMGYVGEDETVIYFDQ